MQAQALNCRNDQYGFERWLTEGMALRVAGQDLPAKSDVTGLQALFSGGTPFDDINSRTFPDFNRYPAYRLSYDTFLGVAGKTDADVHNFLKNYGSTVGCPVTPFLLTGWKAQFDAYFGTGLRGTGALGSTFWTVSPAYAK